MTTLVLLVRSKTKLSFLKEEFSHAYEWPNFGGGLLIIADQLKL